MRTPDGPGDEHAARHHRDLGNSQGAARVMHADRLHRLVAVDSHGRPTGVISAMDFVALAAEG